VRIRLTFTFHLLTQVTDQWDQLPFTISSETAVAAVVANQETVVVKEDVQKPGPAIWSPLYWATGNEP
jgi:hypothetical protein